MDGDKRRSKLRIQKPNQQFLSSLVLSIAIQQWLLSLWIQFFFSFHLFFLAFNLLHLLMSQMRLHESVCEHNIATICVVCEKQKIKVIWTFWCAKQKKKENKNLAKFSLDYEQMEKTSALKLEVKKNSEIKKDSFKRNTKIVSASFL